MMKKVGLAMLMSSTMLLSGCGILLSSSLGGSDTVTSEKKEPVEDAVEVVEVKEENYKIGDTIKMGDLEFTVNSVRVSKESEDFKIETEDGEQYLNIDVTVHNTGDESTSLSSLLMFSLVDTEFYQKDLGLFADNTGSVDGELGAGRTLRGEVSFVVGNSEDKWELIFEPNIFGFGQAIVDVTL